MSQTIEKINSNFSMYFSAMDCAGEVILAQPENNVSYFEIKLNMEDTTFII